MSFYQIFCKEYRNHKFLILFYIALSIILAAFFAPFCNPFMQSGVFAADVNEADTLLSLTTIFTGTSISQLAGSYSQVVGVSCEPFTALLFIGIIENINKLCGSPLSIISTPAGNPVVLIVIAIFFVASKLMRSNEATQVFGIVTLGQLEKYLGLIFILVLGAINVAGVANVFSTSVVNASGLSNTNIAASSTLTYVLSIVFSAFLGLLSLAVFFIIKTVVLGLEVLQMTFSFIPGSAFFFEAAKTILAVTIVGVNVLCPPLGVAINIIIVIICLFLFRMCYAAVNYLKQIYVKPLFRLMRGFDSRKSLVAPKIPKKIRSFAQEQLGEILLCIPVFSVKRCDYPFKIKRYDKCWLLHTKEGNFLCKKRFGKKNIDCEQWDNAEGQSVYMNKALRFFEIFTYIQSPDNMVKKHPKKEMLLVFSKEYYYRYSDIVSMTGYIDYRAIKELKKMDKRQLREQKKLEKEEQRIQRRAMREQNKVIS